MSVIFTGPNFDQIFGEAGIKAFSAWISGNNGLNKGLIETYLATKSEGAELFSVYEAEQMEEIGANDFIVNFENDTEDLIDVVFQGYSASFSFRDLPKLTNVTVSTVVNQLQIVSAAETDLIDEIDIHGSIESYSSDEFFATGCWIYEVSKQFVDSENGQLNADYVKFIQIASLVHLQLFILGSEKLQEDEMGGISDDLQCSRNTFGTVLVNI